MERAVGIELRYIGGMGENASKSEASNGVGMNPPIPPNGAAAHGLPRYVGAMNAEDQEGLEDMGGIKAFHLVYVGALNDVPACSGHLGYLLDE